MAWEASASLLQTGYSVLLELSLVDLRARLKSRSGALYFGPPLAFACIVDLPCLNVEPLVVHLGIFMCSTAAYYCSVLGSFSCT